MRHHRVSTASAPTVHDRENLLLDHGYGGGFRRRLCIFCLIVCSGLTLIIFGILFAVAIGDHMNEESQLDDLKKTAERFVGLAKIAIQVESSAGSALLG